MLDDLDINNLKLITDSAIIRSEPLYGDCDFIPEHLIQYINIKFRRGTIINVFSENEIDLVPDMHVIYDHRCEGAWGLGKYDVIPLNNIWCCVYDRKPASQIIDGTLRARHRLVIIETLRESTSEFIPEYLARKYTPIARVLSVGPDVKLKISEGDIIIFEEHRGGQHIEGNIYIIDSNIILATIEDHDEF